MLRTEQDLKKDAALSLAFVRPVVQPYAAIRCIKVCWANVIRSSGVSIFVACGEHRMVEKGTNVHDMRVLYAEEIVSTNLGLPGAWSFLLGYLFLRAGRCSLSNRCDGTGMQWEDMGLISLTYVRSELKITCKHQCRG